jgi:hypothetical protein
MGRATSLYCQDNAGYRKRLGGHIADIADEAVDIKNDIALIKGIVSNEETNPVVATDVATGKVAFVNGAKITGTATVVINKLDLSDLIVTPVLGETPVETAIEIDQYDSGVITWFAADGTTPHAGAFAAETVYVAKATITANEGYTLRGVDANEFEHDDGAVTNSKDTGNIVITFDATAAA